MNTNRQHETQLFRSSWQTDQRIVSIASIIRKVDPYFVLILIILAFLESRAALGQGANGAVRRMTLASDGFTGIVTTLYTGLNSPAGLATNLTSGFFITGNHAIVNPFQSSNRLVAGQGGTPGFVDGTGSQARFNNPTAILYNQQDNTFYIVDAGNDAIRRMTLASDGFTGIVTTLYTGLNSPAGLATNLTSGFFITGNHAIVNPFQSSNRLVAGQGGTPGFVDGTGSQARFNNPTAILYNQQDNTFYIVDAGNNAIRRMTLASDGFTGIVTTLYTGLNSPAGLATNLTSGFFITGNDAIVNPFQGSNRLVAGQGGTPGFVDGTGFQARFNNPTASLYNQQDNTFYIVDQVPPSSVPASGVLGLAVALVLTGLTTMRTFGRRRSRKAWSRDSRSDRHQS